MVKCAKCEQPTNASRQQNAMRRFKLDSYCNKYCCSCCPDSELGNCQLLSQKKVITF